MVKLTYDSNFLALTQMVSYKALYEKKCKLLLYWDEFGNSGIIGPKLIQEMKEQVYIIKYKHLATQSQQ